MSDTLATIRTLVLDRLNASSNDPFFDPSRVDRTINASNRRLGRVADWPWLMVEDTLTLPTTGTFDLSTVDYYRHTVLLSYQNRELRARTRAELVDYNLSSDNDPRVYSITGNTLRAAPTPSASLNLTHVYVRDEAPLSGDNDAPLLPPAYTELLVLQAAITLAMSKKEVALMQALKTEYKEALKEAVDEVNRTRTPLRVRADESAWAL